MTEFTAEPARNDPPQTVVNLLDQTSATRTSARLAFCEAEAEPPFATEPRSATSSGTLDRTAFARLAAEIDVEGALETFAIFDTDTRRRLLVLTAIALETNRELVQVEAHSLKSTAAMFGFIEVAALAARLEEAALTIEDRSFRAILRDLGSAFATGVVQFNAAFCPVARR